MELIAVLVREISPIIILKVLLTWCLDQVHIHFASRKGSIYAIGTQILLGKRILIVCPNEFNLMLMVGWIKLVGWLMGHSGHRLGFFGYEDWLVVEVGLSVGFAGW